MMNGDRETLTISRCEKLRVLGTVNEGSLFDYIWSTLCHGYLLLFNEMEV